MIEIHSDSLERTNRQNIKVSTSKACGPCGGRSAGRGAAAVIQQGGAEFALAHPRGHPQLQRLATQLRVATRLLHRFLEGHKIRIKYGEKDGFLCDFREKKSQKFFYCYQWSVGLRWQLQLRSVKTIGSNFGRGLPGVGIGGIKKPFKIKNCGNFHRSTGKIQKLGTKNAPLYFFSV